MNISRKIVGKYCLNYHKIIKQKHKVIFYMIIRLLNLLNFNLLGSKLAALGL